MAELPKNYDSVYTINPEEKDDAPNWEMMNDEELVALVNNWDEFKKLSNADREIVTRIVDDIFKL